MEDFPGLLSRDFGFRPQGKSAPMAASRSTGNVGGGGALNFGIGSGNDTRSSSFASNRAKPGLNSNAMGGPILDDNDELFGSAASKKTQDLGGYSDVFGGPPKYSNPSDSRGGSTSFDYDSIFQGSHDSGAKSSSLPVFDKPVYDDDIFDGVPGLKSSSSVKYDDVFSSISSPPKKTATYEDFLGNLGKTEPELKSSSGKKSSEVEKHLPGFDDLIPGFGGSSPPKSKEPSETSQPQQSSVPPTKSTSRTIEDPFVVLETTSAPAYSSSGLFSDPLEQISKLGESKSTKADGSSVSGKVFDDMDPLSGLGKSFPVFSTDLNSRRKDVSPTKSGYTSSGKEPSGKASINTSENSLQKKAPVDIFQEPHQTMFDMPTVSSDYKSVGKTDSQPSYVNSSETNSDTSPRSEENVEAVDDVWLTVSEIPLFTQPTSAPPPSRPPPPRPTRNLKANRTYFGSENAKKKVNEFSSLPNSTRNFQSPTAVPDVAKSSNVSTIDELEEFAMGRNQNNIEECVDVISSEEEAETNYTAAASAAAMKEAMERAEAKFKHAKGVRERENAKAAKSKEVSQQEMDEKAIHDTQEREIRAKQERLDNERQQKEIEEKEREQRRLEKERERAREIEREREKAGRQAVERATREARERAAAEARLRAERTAVDKANAEARERAERAAVQRAQNEARERAAAEARERAERAAAEARERTNAEAREKEARERAAVARAEAEARRRAERAAVERAAAEARERAAAAARENQQKNERTAPASRENQQMNENDLESFFNMGARPSSVPRPRANTSDPFDTQFQNKGGSEGPRRTSVGTTSSMRKVSSTTNIVDDLTSIFGAAPSSGVFPEIDGESEERRRARLERHQRTQERASKALAEKNERDLQAQRDQAERHRIAETLDIEIRRWAAGKEGNLRALLSTLQYVLWPESGWQPVSLTDLITSISVKKVYRKATLCIHPDKVQQKGATLQQKYIAEKVFDLLKEAWNKFNSEELF